MEKLGFDDVGEFLPYARKHLISVSESSALPTVSNDEKLKLSFLWPEPNWAEIRDFDPNTLVRWFVLYKNIRREPRQTNHWGVPKNKWGIAYAKSLEILQRLFVTVRTDEQFDKLLERYIFELKKAFPEYTSETKKIQDCYHKFSTGTDNSKKRIGSAFTFGAREHLLIEWLAKFDWPSNRNAAKYRYFPVVCEDSTWCVVTPTKSSYSWNQEDEGLSELEALNLAKKRNEAEFPQLQEKKADTDRNEKPKVYIPRKKTVLSDARIGPAYRTNDATPEDLLSEFGFRGVQFGNALSTVERQQWVNDAYDAFCDLADALGFKRSWIGLGGVGLAFGARGAGSGSAHFEPSLNITNLTRNSGAGSFAHEFFHALDYRIGNKIIRGEYLTANLIDKHHLIFRIDDSQYVNTSFIPKIESLYEVYCLIGGFSSYSSEYYIRSNNLAQQHGAKKYWIDPIELFARAFECYVQDLLQADARYSPWLVHGTLESDCEPKHEHMWPYPIKSERAQLNSKFDAFIKILKNPSQKAG